MSSDLSKYPNLQIRLCSAITAFSGTSEYAEKATGITCNELDKYCLNCPNANKDTPCSINSLSLGSIEYVYINPFHSIFD